ncbi:protein mono-ADP-ribosyltransferase TIPARP-like [Pelobates fuscus]|uniref:protein mono-ADP-ribosyltransferase TIPARP-like n=1 Tax=Pelobates fuscus TaxID=191477 RepID=UPI002FE4CA27
MHVLSPQAAIAKVTSMEPSEEEKALHTLESVCFVHAKTSHGCVLVDNHREELQKIQYHIHHEDDIEICSRFLNATCLQGSLCSRHHTVLPYAWQLREKTTHIWQSVGGCGQEMLERLYSNPKTVHLKGMVNKQDKMLINFATMEVALSPIFDRIRRLSTSTCPSLPFCTHLKYYYEEGDNSWKEFSPDVTKRIEENVREGLLLICIKTRRFNYLVDLRHLIQENVQTGTRRRIRARPLFQSPTLMLSKLWTIQNFQSPTFCTNSHPAAGGLYPATWHITSTTLIHERVLLDCEEQEFQEVYSYFHKTVPEAEFLILGIYRLQNYFQWQKYDSKRMYMTQRLAKTEVDHVERHLFHGTEPALVEAICRQNFDTRVSTRNGRSFGHGCYFATQASYSLFYSTADARGHRFMFLAKVLVGRSTLGRAELRRPPLINPNDPESPLYDSCVNKINNPSIFVLFDNDQFYPYFLIRYQKLRNIVALD